MKTRGYSVLAVVFAAGLSQAAILPPTGSSPAPPTVFGTDVTGPFLADTGLLNFTATNSLGQTTITGEYRAAVYSDPANGFCAGCLDFFVVVDSDVTSTDDANRITLANFGSFLTDVGYTLGNGSIPGGLDPASVDRSKNGNVIGFNFYSLGGIGPGEASQVLEIETNATSYTKGTLQIIDSSVASVTAFAPSAVPEASSVSMTLLGGLLLGLGFIGRRRRATR
ncbi:MAG TPA: hypothetical protein VMG35_16945 [Bryobacteraceae bacterium]|nr:hypothetical protein [Bryobacteraceae bacterium]